MDRRSLCQSHYHITQFYINQQMFSENELLQVLLALKYKAAFNKLQYLVEEISRFH